MAGLGPVSSNFPGGVGAEALVINGIQAYLGSGTASGYLVDRNGDNIVSDFSGSAQTTATQSAIDYLQSVGLSAAAYTSTGAPTQQASTLATLPSNSASWTSSQIADLSPADIASLTLTQLAELSPTQISYFSPAQIGELSQEQIGSLTASQFSAVSSGQAAALTNSQIAAISSQQITTSPASQVSAANKLVI